MVEHASEETEDADALSLIADHWKKIGIKMLFKPQTRENFRLRTFSGEALMTAYAGIVTAVPTVDTSPKEFAPTMQGGLQWSRWGMFIESKGKQGEKCDLKEACELLDYLREWETSTDEATRRKAWEKILETNADEVFSIGTVNGIQPADRGRPEGQERAEGRLLRLGSGRLHRPLQARHVLDVAVILPTRRLPALADRCHSSLS